VQADWTFILPSELPTKELHHLLRKMPPQAYQTSQNMVPRGGIFLGKWHSTFAGSSDSKMNVQSACPLNTLYNIIVLYIKLQYNKAQQFGQSDSYYRQAVSHLLNELDNIYHLIQ
jgi:hypothetical protein